MESERVVIWTISSGKDRDFFHVDVHYAFRKSKQGPMKQQTSAPALGTWALLFLTYLPANAWAQTSPFFPGQRHQEVMNILADPRESEGFHLLEESPEQIISVQTSDASYEAKVVCHFSGDVSNRVLVEWIGKTVDYRYVLRQLFDQQITAMNATGNYERDTTMEATLIRSFAGKFALAAVFVTEDQSRRHIFLFYTKPTGAFFSHMDQVYVFEDPLREPID